MCQFVHLIPHSTGQFGLLIPGEQPPALDCWTRARLGRNLVRRHPGKPVRAVGNWVKWSLSRPFLRGPWHRSRIHSSFTFNFSFPCFRRSWWNDGREAVWSPASPLIDDALVDHPRFYSMFNLWAQFGDLVGQVKGPATERRILHRMIERSEIQLSKFKEIFYW